MTAIQGSLTGARSSFCFDGISTMMDMGFEPAFYGFWGDSREMEFDSYIVYHANPRRA